MDRTIRMHDPSQEHGHLIPVDGAPVHWHKTGRIAYRMQASTGPSLIQTSPSRIRVEFLQIGVDAFFKEGVLPSAPGFDGRATGMEQGTTPHFVTPLLGQVRVRERQTREM